MIIIIAKVLSVDNVGAFSLAMAITAPIALFASLRLRSLIVVRDSENNRDYYFIRKIFNIVSLVITLIVAFLFYQEYFILITLVMLIKINDLNSELAYGYYQLKMEFNKLSRLIIFKQIFSLIVFVISLSITKSLQISLLLQYLFQYTYFLIWERKDFLNDSKHNPSRETQKSIIKEGLPIGIGLYFITLNASIPRFILEAKHGLEMLGYFSALAYFVVIGNILVNSLMQFLLGKISNLYISNNFRTLRKVLFLFTPLFTVSLGVVILPLTIFFGEYFIAAFYGELYTEYLLVLVLLVIGFLLDSNSAIYDSVLLITKKIKVQFYLPMFLMVVSSIIGYIMINQYSIYGAALTIIIVNLIQLLIRGFFCNSILKSNEQMEELKLNLKNR
ncbi:oligosaccharide flippase family protein [Sporosarcina sp. Marseille-Q4063]|uniref:oligosaccharide flippase family protein n=1 Tax=Sporosarcina sp. Marseille-Q4063 TaxID=2810514 RepID=UPI002739ED55|nr:oligosaccharide flippase family protein [Sporosarcina sp. Marseille-Q4063]